ncbi:hypothetical protein Axi01nite_32990 [Actinoplanes xinjiangensis]|nr:hypothetical protein Axi01nite_32990 [Actinoplanes xinjiangensis]
MQSSWYRRGNRLQVRGKRRPTRKYLFCIDACLHALTVSDPFGSRFGQRVREMIVLVGYRVGMPISRDSGDPIHVEIILEGDDSDGALTELRKWLRSDEDLIGVRVDPVGAAARPDQMSGGLVEALVATVTDPGLLAALFAGVGGWAAARASTRRTRIRVKIGDREVEMEGPALRDPEGVARRLRTELGEAP